MIFLRTALIAMLLNAMPLAQAVPTTADATVVATATAASVYLTINNPTMYDIYVMSATSDAAGKVELFSGDKPVENMTVAAYGSLTLKTGGMSLRLSDLKRSLKAGENVTITLVTDGGIQIVAAALVK